MANKPRKQQAKPTLAQVARAAGVSNTTASYVVNGLAAARHISEATAEHVQAVAALMNYRPNRWAQNLVSKRTRTIGALYGNLRNDWADRSSSGMRKVLDAAGYLLFLTTHRLDAAVEKQEIDTLLQLQVEAIICPGLPDGLPAYQSILSQGIPLVFLETKAENMPEVSSVAWDGEHAAYAGVRHLVETGCRRIAFLGRDYPGGTPSERYMPWHHMVRHNGYVLALEEEGLSPDESHKACFLLDEPVQEKVTRMFSGARPPDAIFATLDMLALEAIQVLRDMGLRVPEDVAVAGMGDQPAGGELGAGLTTVRGPDELLGKHAAEVALQLIEDKSTGPIHRLIDANEVVVRRTSVPSPTPR